MREPTEMELQVAEALWRRWLTSTRDQSGVHSTFKSALAAWPGKCQRFLDDALAAIRAMHDPTEEMMTAGRPSQPLKPTNPAIRDNPALYLRWEQMNRRRLRAIYTVMVNAASPPE